MKKFFRILTVVQLLYQGYRYIKEKKENEDEKQKKKKKKKEEKKEENKKIKIPESVL